MLLEIYFWEVSENSRSTSLNLSPIKYLEIYIYIYIYIDWCVTPHNHITLCHFTVTRSRAMSIVMVVWRSCIWACDQEKRISNFRIYLRFYTQHLNGGINPHVWHPRRVGFFVHRRHCSTEIYTEVYDVKYIFERKQITIFI